MSIRISPSILSADFCNLERDLAKVGNADLIHVDVMDGHFVPNLTIGLPVVKRINEVSKVPLDVHLMLDDPDRWAVEYARLGAYSVTFHFEAAKNPQKIISELRSAGSRVGMAVKPKTALKEYEQLLPELDMLLLMTVEPGFGGQKLIPEVLDKVPEVIKHRPDLSLAVDGGVNEENIAAIAAAGVDTFVAGSNVFLAPSPAEQVERLRALAQESAPKLLS